MTYLTGVAKDIQHSSGDVQFSAKSADYIIVENSKNQTDDTVREIIKSAGFFPFISKNRVNGNVLFTVVPYKIPISFNGDLLFQIPLSRQVDSSYRRINERIKTAALENPKNHTPHFTQNKTNILSLAEGLTGEALILGLGNADDIPLEELAGQFDLITALDIDMIAMQKTIAKLPTHLQSKIRPFQKDLTGIISSISKEVELLGDVSRAEILDEVAEIINRNIDQFQSSLSSSKKYKFVVSSMLTSQLFSQIHEYIKNVLEKKYPGIDPMENKNCFDAIDKLMKSICTEHLENLSKWVLSEGRIYYADTIYYQRIEAENIVKNALIKKVLYKTLPNDEIDNTINKTFRRLKGVQNWPWQTSQEGLMIVAAHSLQPK